MHRVRTSVVLALMAASLPGVAPRAAAPPAQTAPTYQQFLSPASPLEIVAARRPIGSPGRRSKKASATRSPPPRRHSRRTA